MRRPFDLEHGISITVQNYKIRDTLEVARIILQDDRFREAVMNLSDKARLKVPFQSGHHTPRKIIAPEYGASL
jgi:hypothetical protein